MSQVPIITLSDSGLQSENWQWHMRNLVTDAHQLAAMLDLNLDTISTAFPLRVPLPYIARMEAGNPEDPLLRQVLPIDAEHQITPGFVADPLSESDFTSATRGIIQKYHGRVLVVATGACAVNCRYCFRRHFPYEDHQTRNSDWDSLISAIATDTSISEVIFSGGDPLVLSDERLAKLTSAIDAIPHVQTLRFHTRVPVVIPQRISADLLSWVDDLSSEVVFVLHVNHANEIDEDFADAISPLRQKQHVTLLNQAVLLKKVNDRPDALIALSTRLFRAGILPYYLHLLDPVSGAQHFDVPEARGRQLIKEITTRLPGYLVPKLVREVPGEMAKQPIPLD